jgi:serine/threonine-protein kinase HipA
VSELLIAIEGSLIGRLRVERSGRLSLDYTTDWQASAASHSLSVSMPLAQISYPQKIVMPYLWNLLPENENVLQRWAQQYHVSAGNPFKLLAHVGADVPGAAQFIPPERLEEIQTERRPAIEWMTSDELAERLRQLRADIAAVRRPGDLGKMSLPGAQAKTAYYYDSEANRWGVPSGRAPTTHIIKPCVPGFDGLVENEHLCQNIAGRLGMPAANSFVLALDETYIVVERYDRLPPLSGSPFVQRIHQEDVCQALGLMPGKKYQEDGGPGIAQIVTLIRRVSSDPETDVDRFLQANMLNWFIGGTDAHAKNYSLLIGAGDEVRLAPLYDVSSQLPYRELIQQRLSMKIGDHDDIGRIGIEDWRKVARTSALEEDRILAMLTDMGRALPDHISGEHEQATTEGLSEKVVGPLARQLIEHAKERLAAITGGSYSRRSTPGKSRRGASQGG